MATGVVVTDVEVAAAVDVVATTAKVVVVVEVVAVFEILLLQAENAIPPRAI
jgi:hypothetical protein